MKKLFYLFVFSFSLLGNAQTGPGNVQQSFGALSGFDNTVSAIAVQADGKILVGGSFTAYNGSIENRIIRLNTDGTKDTTFNSGAGFGNGSVNAIVVQPDGKILVGGSFGTYNSANFSGLLRLNADGTRDNTFNSGSSFNINATINTIALQGDGKILVGGTFTTFAGQTANRIIRLNTNGYTDTSFVTGSGFGSPVTAIQIQNDNKIVVGGNFTQYQGASANGLIRLETNGNKDTSFFSSATLTVSNTLIAIQNDQKIVVNGNFNDSSSPTPLGNKIIRFNTDGTVDTSFSTNTKLDVPSSAMLLQSDGKILVGGMMATFNSVAVDNIFRIDTNGDLDTSFTTTGTGLDHTVQAIALQSDGKIIVGGMFSAYNGAVENRIIRLNSDGSKGENLTTTDSTSGFGGFINKLIVQSDEKILVGGNFSSYKNEVVKFLIRLNTDGTRDTSFTGGTTINTLPHVLAIQSNQKILIGCFYNHNGVFANRVVRLDTDGTLDTGFTLGTGGNNNITKIVPLANGKILVGGNFTTYNGTTANRIVRLNADGTMDTTFVTGTGFNSTVSEINVQTDGKILIGGNFTSYNTTTSVNRLVRLNEDGSIDTAFVTAIGTGFDTSINRIAIQSDGKIVIGGNFATFNGVTTNKIVRLLADGTRDNTFTIGTGFGSGVSTIELQSDNKMIVGGSFTTYNGLTENRIIRLNENGEKDSSFVTGTGFNSIVIATALLNDKVIVAGNFLSYNANPNTSYLVSLNASASGTLHQENYTTKDAIVLSPNPTKDYFNLEGLDTTPVLSTRVYDIQGKLLCTTQSKTIDVSTFPAGMYLVKITTENGETVKKMIKE